MKEFSGTAWKLGDDIDTDIIIPTQHLALKTIDEMKQFAFAPLGSDFTCRLQEGTIIVAGKNFGCGSSREQASEVLSALNIKCIIAKSFARIFFRNAINNGILLIEQADFYDCCNEGDFVEVRPNDKIICKNKAFGIGRLPNHVLKLIEKGGLISYMKDSNQTKGGNAHDLS